MRSKLVLPISKKITQEKLGQRRSNKDNGQKKCGVWESTMVLEYRDSRGRWTLGFDGAMIQKKKGDPEKGGE